MKKAGKKSNLCRATVVLTAIAAAPKGLTKHEIFAAVVEYQQLLEEQSLAAAERNFVRDLNYLRSAGYPIVTHKTREQTGQRIKQVYCLADDVRPTLKFSPHEELLVQAALRYWDGNNRSTELFSLRCKLAAHLGAISTDFGELSLGEYATSNAALIILTAIISQQQIRFEYQRPGGTKRLRTVSPQRLHTVQGKWHLLGYDENLKAVRVFLLSRIIATVETLDVDATLLPQAELEKVCAEIESGVVNTEVSVLFRQNTLPARALLDRYTVTGFRSAAQPVVFNAGDLTQLGFELAQLHPIARPLSPRRLVAVQQELLAAVANSHKNSQSENFCPVQEKGAISHRGGPRVSNSSRVLLLQALQTLLQKREHTLQELCAYFALSEETILAHVKALNEMYSNLIDVQAASTQVRIHISGSSTLQWLRLEGQPTIVGVCFTHTELALLRETLAIFRSALHAEISGTVDSAIEKLDNAILQLQTGRGAPLAVTQSHDSRQIVSGAARAGAETEAQFQILLSALAKREVIAFNYSSASSKMLRYVFPLELRASRGSWMLTGYCFIRQAVRNFELSRLREPHQYPKSELLAAFPNAETVMSELSDHAKLDKASADTGYRQLVFFWVKKSKMGELAGFQPVFYSSPVIKTDLSMAQDWILGSIELWQPENVIALVASVLTDIEIASPAAARERVFRWASSTD